MDFERCPRAASVVGISADARAARAFSQEQYPNVDIKEVVGPRLRVWLGARPGVHAAGLGRAREPAEAAKASSNCQPAQIAALRIEVAPVGPGMLSRTVRVPGNVMMDPDRIGHVPAKVIGTVVELRKRLGDVVQKGEVVAYLESREVADAKSEFLTAGANLELQTTLFERERSLFEKKISAEQQFLRAENAFSLSKLRHDLARQKLSALDVDEAEIAELPKQPVANLRRYALRSPIAGRVIERRVDLGAPVGGDQQEKEIYVVADLSSVWVELRRLGAGPRAPEGGRWHHDRGLCAGEGHRQDHLYQPDGEQGDPNDAGHRLAR